MPASPGCGGLKPILRRQPRYNGHWLVAPGARQSPPLRTAFLYRARLKAVRRQTSVDRHGIDPWHLAALVEGLRLRMDHALRIVDRGRSSRRRGVRSRVPPGWPVSVRLSGPGRSRVVPGRQAAAPWCVSGAKPLPPGPRALSAGRHTGERTGWWRFWRHSRARRQTTRRCCTASSALDRRPCPGIRTAKHRALRSPTK